LPTLVLALCLRVTADVFMFRHRASTTVGNVGPLQPQNPLPPHTLACLNPPHTNLCPCPRPFYCENDGGGVNGKAGQGGDMSLCWLQCRALRRHLTLLLLPL